MWLIGDALLFFANDLDPTTNHTIEMINVSDGLNLWLNSITVFTANGTSANATTTSGTSSVVSSSGSATNSVPPSGSATNSAAYVAYFM